ncbi:MAG: glycosyltransferase family 2 protein [Verrucomicrobiota bacterium]
MKKLNVSVCILAKDEEANLPRCLAPLEAFDEVIVLDSGSEDKTVEIARQWGATVIEESWQGFGATRKKLFQAASKPWILWLDADEVVPQGLVDEIQKVAGMKSNRNGFWINRITYIGKKRFHHGNWYPDWNLRFFRTEGWFMEERDVHERIQVHGETGRFFSCIDHYSYRNWAERKERSQRYAKLWAAEAFRDGRRVTFFDQVGHSFACFVKAFFLKLGFLDGFSGLRLAFSNASEVSDKYRRLRLSWTRYGAGG